MIPFVAAGGLLIALGFLFAGYGIALTPKGASANNAVLTLQTFTLLHLPPQGFFYYLGAVLFEIGGLSFGFLVPALAGYIAYAIADRPGIAPGFVVGAVSGFLGAGFLGGIVGGFLAGYAALLIGRPAVPRWLRGLMPVVIIPLLASIISSGLMILVLGGPIAAITKGLTVWLNSLDGAGAIVLGIILGLMMCFDLGGPVNKTAYVFATTGLAAGGAGSFRIMAAVMAAGMVPPIAMALASTVLYRRGFSEVERENGVAAWLLGASFISEGAIPFAAADPLRVIPSSMIGGAVTGALSMGLGLQSRAPHGGIFVFFAIGPTFLASFLLWFLSIVIGAVVTAVVLIGLKRFVRPRGRDEVVEPATSASAQPVAAAV
jgi:PTS system fructose-specific IIC component